VSTSAAPADLEVRPLAGLGQVRDQDALAAILGVEVARKSTDTNSAGFVKIVETRVARFQGGFQHACWKASRG